MKSIEQAKAESTCQKRVTVVQIIDEKGYIVACESNRCAPEGRTCHRMGVVQGKENYDTHSHCNWAHAEINAINALPEGAKPKKAILYGHDFYCQPCEDALRAVGVTEFKVKPFPKTCSRCGKESEYGGMCDSCFDSELYDDMEKYGDRPGWAI
jgi:deoxycytidylate deaminase